MNPPGLPLGTYRHPQTPGRSEPHTSFPSIPSIPRNRTPTRLLEPQPPLRSQKDENRAHGLDPGLIQNRLVNGTRSRDNEDRPHENPALTEAQRHLASMTEDRKKMPPPRILKVRGDKARKILTQSALDRSRSRMYPQIDSELSNDEDSDEPFEYPIYDDPFRDYDPTSDNALDEAAANMPSLQAQKGTVNHSRFSKLASSQRRDKGLRLQDSDTSVSSTISKDNTAGERARQASLLAHYGSKVNSKNRLRNDGPVSRPSRTNGRSPSSSYDGITRSMREPSGEPRQEARSAFDGTFSPGQKVLWNRLNTTNWEVAEITQVAGDGSGQSYVVASSNPDENMDFDVSASNLRPMRWGT